MRQLDLFNPLLASGERDDLEFKSAKGGIPASLWESYAAMANTRGGMIYLGVSQKNGGFVIDGLENAAALEQQIRDALNNRQKISANLSGNDGVFSRSLDGRQVVCIDVPRATRAQRPVYVGSNPMTGTFRRDGEGDYHCSEDEVRRMLADQSDEPADSRIVAHFTADDLHSDTLKQYRNRFASRDPAHPWLSEDTLGFLRKLGAWRLDRPSGQEGITVAGLLMFGSDDALRDKTVLPGYMIDFRERLSEDPAVRWTDRVTLDGTWEGNLFQFYSRVIQRLSADLKIPFQLDSDLYRKDDTIVHEALREAVVNSLIHADYRGQGGIVIEKYRDRIELSNPGSLLVSLDQLKRGGVSECRNKTLQIMFRMIGGGEQAGSGMDKIRAGWASQHWRSPRLEETVRPDRVRVLLPMVSLIPDEASHYLQARFGERFNALDELGVQALVTAHLEGSVSNSRMQEVTGKHPTDITRVLQKLAQDGLLVQAGAKRGTSYRLPAVVAGLGGEPPSSPLEQSPLHLSANSPHLNANSPHLNANSPHLSANSPHLLEPSPATDAALLEIARPARESKKLPREQLSNIIVQLCADRWLTTSQLAELLSRDAENLQGRFLTALVREGALELKYPDVRNRPNQAYRTKPRVDAKL
jgi:ATP-dependent DNA helicase RecG